MLLPERIKAARKRAGLSQRQVAAAMGKSYGAIALWEIGRRAPGRENLRLLAHVLQVSPSEFAQDIHAYPFDDSDSAAVISAEEIELLLHWRGMSARSQRNLLKICRKAAEIRMQRHITRGFQQHSDAA